ncbi:hypothetical protein NQ318_015169 [Aromia moschata]|uniref:RNase H type-1 domain-containing protein n=1 Tax=Aromia moschata TaxID=1265417 RepID=A0AAV8XX37_9CUCU|nr:hypothetical protein NQ318_015169 [Aromia moschata]
MRERKTEVQQNGTIWYTDGSKTEQSTGAGATNTDPGCEISINLGNLATVFQAEITAISACAQEMTRRSYTNKRIQIIYDSQAALKALGAAEIHSQAVKDYGFANTTSVTQQYHSQVDERAPRERKSGLSCKERG